MKPFFSIVIAVNNRENLIIRALESLLNQSYTNWEAIIVDDCSTDNTLMSIKPFLSDSRLRLIISEKNLGVACARNLGINNAFGNYITFLDSDDEYKLNHLSSRYEILLDSKIDLLHGGVEIIGNNYVPDKNDISKMISLNDCIVGGTFFINTNIKKELMLFDENVKYSEDSLMYELFEQHNLIIEKTVIKTYIYHRDTDNSICNMVNK